MLINLNIYDFHWNSRVSGNLIFLSSVRYGTPDVDVDSDKNDLGLFFPLFQEWFIKFLGKSLPKIIRFSNKIVLATFIFEECV